MTLEDKVTLKLTFENVEEFKTTSSDSSLIRPYLKAFTEGKYIGTLNNIFYGYGMKPTFVLGTLEKTPEPKSKIIFFPGVKGRKMVRYISQQRIFEPLQTENIIADHFTLEKLEKWHVTMYNHEGKKVSKIPQMSAINISDDLKFWFSLSIKNEFCLEKTPSELTIEFPLHPSDSNRRIDIISKARKDAVLHIVSLPENSTVGYISKEEFLNFEFYLDLNNDDTQSDKLGQIIAPTGPPVLKFKLIDIKNISYRVCPVKLPKFDGIIWVRASKLPGILNEDCIITCP